MTKYPQCLFCRVLIILICQHPKLKMAKTGMSFPPPRMAQNGQQYQTSQQQFNRVVGSVPQEPEMIPSHYVQQAEDEPQQVQKEPLTAEMLAKAQPQAFFENFRLFLFKFDANYLF